MARTVGPSQWLDETAASLGLQAVQPLLDDATEQQRQIGQQSPQPSFESSIPSLDALLGPSPQSAAPAPTAPPDGGWLGTLPSLTSLLGGAPTASPAGTAPFTATGITPAIGASGIPAAMPTGQATADVSQIASAGTRASRFAPQIARVAAEEGVPPDVLAAIIDTEDSGETSTSVDGARGLTQVVPGQGFDLPGEDASDPLTSIRQSARALKEKYRMAGGDWQRAGGLYFGQGTDSLGNTSDVYQQKFDANRARYQTGAGASVPRPPGMENIPLAPVATPLTQNDPRADRSLPSGTEGPLTRTDPRRQDTGGGLDVQDVAQRYGGGSYVFGGGRDAKGGLPGAKDSDCSSFVSGVWRERGLNLTAHTDGAYNQLRSLGAKQVDAASAQPGDVVFYMGGGYGGAITYHMGIYAGPGQVLDQSTWNGQGGVKLRPLTHAGTMDDIVILRDPRVNGRVDPRTAEAPPAIKPSGLAESPLGQRIAASGGEDAPPNAAGASPSAPAAAGPVVPPGDGAGAPGDMQKMSLEQPSDDPGATGSQDANVTRRGHFVPTPNHVPLAEAMGGSPTMANTDYGSTRGQQRDLRTIDGPINVDTSPAVDYVAPGTRNRAVAGEVSEVSYPPVPSTEPYGPVDPSERNRAVRAPDEASLEFGGPPPPAPRGAIDGPYPNQMGDQVSYRLPLGATAGPDTTPDAPQSTYNDPTDTGTQTSPLPPQSDPSQVAVPEGWTPPEKPDYQYAGSVDTAPPAAGDDPGTQQAGRPPQIAAQSLMDGLKPIYDLAGRIVGYVQHAAQGVAQGAQSITNQVDSQYAGPVQSTPGEPDYAPSHDPGQRMATTIANEGIVRPVVRPISNAIRAATGREPLTADTEPVPSIDRAITETARSLGSNADAVQQGVQQGAYGQAALGALGVAGDLAPSMLLARQLNEMSGRADTPIGQVGAGDVVMTAALGHDAARLGYGAIQAGGRTWSKIAQAISEGVPAERFSEWLNAAADTVDRGIEAARGLPNPFERGGPLGRPLTPGTPELNPEWVAVQQAETRGMRALPSPAADAPSPAAAPTASGPSPSMVAAGAGLRAAAGGAVGNAMTPEDAPWQERAGNIAAGAGAMQLTSPRTVRAIGRGARALGEEAAYQGTFGPLSAARHVSQPGEMQLGSGFVPSAGDTGAVPTRLAPARVRTYAADVAASHAENGGSTINPTQGDMVGKPLYSVSLYPEQGIVIQGRDVTPQDIETFLNEKGGARRKILEADPRISVGTWFNQRTPENPTGDNKHYIDLSATLGDRQLAENLGRAYNQKAIYGLKDLEEIPTGGSGAVPSKPLPPVDQRLPLVGEADRLARQGLTAQAQEIMAGAHPDWWNREFGGDPKAMAQANRLEAGLERTLQAGSDASGAATVAPQDLKPYAQPTTKFPTDVIPRPTPPQELRSVIQAGLDHGYGDWYREFSDDLTKTVGPKRSWEAHSLFVSFSAVLDPETAKKFTLATMMAADKTNAFKGMDTGQIAKRVLDEYKQSTQGALPLAERKGLYYMPVHFSNVESIYGAGRRDVGAPKLSNFFGDFFNGRLPWQNDAHPTNDVHMQRLEGYRAWGEEGGKLGNDENAYRYGSAMTRHVAASLGVPPEDAQAAGWVVQQLSSLPTNTNAFSKARRLNLADPATRPIWEVAEADWKALGKGVRDGSVTPGDALAEMERLHLFDLHNPGSIDAINADPAIQDLAAAYKAGGHKDLPMPGSRPRGEGLSDAPGIRGAMGHAPVGDRPWMSADIRTRTQNPLNQRMLEQAPSVTVEGRSAGGGQFARDLGVPNRLVETGQDGTRGVALPTMNGPRTTAVASSLADTLGQPVAVRRPPMPGEAATHVQVTIDAANAPALPRVIGDVRRIAEEAGAEVHWDGQQAHIFVPTADPAALEKTVLDIYDGVQYQGINANALRLGASRVERIEPGSGGAVAHVAASQGDQAAALAPWRSTRDAELAQRLADAFGRDTGRAAPELRPRSVQPAPPAALGEAAGSGAVPRISPGLRSAAFNAAQGAVVGDAGASQQEQQTDQPYDLGRHLAYGAGGAVLAAGAGNGTVRRAVGELGSGFVPGMHNLEGRIAAAQARVDALAPRLEAAASAAQDAERSGTNAEVAVANRTYSAVRSQHDAASQALEAIREQARAVSGRIEQAGYGRPVEQAGIATSAQPREGTAPYSGQPGGAIPRTVDDTPRTVSLGSGFVPDNESHYDPRLAQEPVLPGMEPPPRPGATPPKSVGDAEAQAEMRAEGAALPGMERLATDRFAPVRDAPAPGDAQAQAEMRRSSGYLPGMDDPLRPAGPAAPLPPLPAEALTPAGMNWYQRQATRNAARMQAQGIEPLSPLRWIRNLASTVGYSSMIGPGTFSVSLASNALEPLYAIPKEVARGVVRAGQTGNMAALREPGAMAAGALTGFGHVGQALWDVIRERGQYAPNPDMAPLSQRTANPAGRLLAQALEVPGRVWSGVPDAIFGTIAEHAGRAREAAQTATNEGLSGQAWSRRVDQLLTDARDVTAGQLPQHAATDQIVKAGDAYAARMSYRDRLGTVGRDVKAATRMGNIPVVSNLIAPFFNTPWNMMLRQAERSPVGLAMNTQKGFDKHYDAIVGTALIVGLGGAAQAGYVTGSGPTDPAQRKLLEADGWKPYHTLVALPGQQPMYVPNRFFGIAETLLNGAGDVHDAAAYRKPSDDARTLQQDALARIGSLVSQQPFAAGYTSIANLVNYGPESFAADQATRMTPFASSARMVGTAMDTQERRPDTGADVTPLQDFAGRYAAGVGNRAGLPVAQDVLGHEQPNQQQGGWAVLPRFSPQTSSPVADAFRGAQMTIGQPPSDVQGVALSPDQKRRYQQIMGQQLETMASGVVSNASWAAMPLVARKAVLSSFHDAASQVAEARVIGEMPDFGRRYGDATVRKAQGLPSVPYRQQQVVAP